MRRSTKVAWAAAGIGLLLVFVGLAAFGVYWFQRDRNQNAALHKAGNALSQNDFETAIALFDQALRLRLPSAKAASAYYGRAHAKNETGKYDEAIRDFSESIRLNPEGIDAYWGRGFAYQRKEDWDKALSDYAEVLRRDRNAGQVYFNRGLIYLQRKEWAKAVEDFSEAIRCEPKNSYAYLDRGAALAELGDLDGALASLDSAILINPELAQAYQDRAAIHQRKGNLDRARSDEFKATQLAPKSLPSVSVPSVLGSNASVSDLLNAAQMAVINGRHDEAIDLCDQAIQAKPGSSYLSHAFMTRGNAYAGKGDWDHALRDYDEAVKAEPANADAWVNRGNAYAHKRQRDKSLRDYNEALRLNPKMPQAYCNRALNYLDSGKVDKALADLNEAIRLNPKFAEAYSRRAFVLLRLKRKDDALADAETALTLRPDSGEAFLFRARLRLARREFAEARLDFERALQHSREPKAPLWNDVAWFFATCPDQSGRDGKKAVELATKACELTQWKNAHTLDTLAAAFAETGDFDQAMKSQSQALSLADAPAAERSGMKKRLALYQKRRPYREQLKP